MTPLETIPFNQKRKLIYERMTVSLQTTAQYTLHAEMNATPLVELKKHLSVSIEKKFNSKLTYTPFFVKLAAIALVQVPLLNANLIDRSWIKCEEINIGVAVALPDGLIAPVIHAVKQKSWIDLMLDLNDLKSRAEKGTLKIEDLTGGTFTITNLGPFGIDSFTPIINLPEVSILGLGRITKKPVVDEEGTIVVRDMITLSLTSNHQVIDGSVAATFLSTFRTILEDPTALNAAFELEQN